MRKFSAKIGVTTVFALALYALSISQASAQAGGGGGGGGGQGAPQVDCGAGDSIQDAVNSAVDGVTITVSGTCTEIVTITTNGITIIGDPAVGGTLIGGFTVKSAVRVVFDDLTVKDGTNHGIRAEEGASVRVINSTIENHARDGVSIANGSNALIEGNTIRNNGRYGVIVASGSSARLKDNPLIQSNVFNTPRTQLDPFTATTIGVFHNSFARLLGGNLIVNDGGGIAVEVFHISDFRQEKSSDRIEGTRAISIGNGSVGELRGEYEVTGRVDVSLNSTLRLSKRFGPVGVINGQIRVLSDSAVIFSLFTLSGETEDLGSVTVNGRLNCFGNQGHIGLFGGQVPADIIPSAANRAASQCNDFNGNLVLPVFGP